MKTGKPAKVLEARARKLTKKPLCAALMPSIITWINNLIVLNALCAMISMNKKDICLTYSSKRRVVKKLLRQILFFCVCIHMFCVDHRV